MRDFIVGDYRKFRTMRTKKLEKQQYLSDEQDNQEKALHAAMQKIDIHTEKLTKLLHIDKRYNK